MNRKLIVLVALVVFAMMLSLSAFGQEIAPRRRSTATPTATAPAPAETTTDTAETTTDPEATPAETGPSTEAIDQRLTALENAAKQFIVTKEKDLLVEAIAQLNARDKAQQEEIANLTKDGKILLWQILILLIGLFALTIRVLFFNRNRHDDDKETTTNTTTRIVTMITVGFLGLGLVSQSAQAACTIKSVGGTGLIVMSQAAAPVSINVAGCDVKEIEGGITSVVFTDVATKGGVVTAKVTAAASNENGPMGFTLVLADGNRVDSPDPVYFLVMTPEGGTNFKASLAAKATAQAAQATANATAKRISALDAKVKSLPTKAEITNIVDSRVKTLPTRAEVQATVNPVDARVRELEKFATAQAEEMEMLREAIDTTALGVQRLAETKKGILRRPLNSKVAKAMAEIRSTLAPLPVEEGQ